MNLVELFRDAAKQHATRLRLERGFLIVLL